MGANKNDAKSKKYEFANTLIGVYLTQGTHQDKQELLSERQKNSNICDLFSLFLFLRFEDNGKVASSLSFIDMKQRGKLIPKHFLMSSSSIKTKIKAAWKWKRSCETFY